jgi:transcriptional activator SPT7
MLKKVKQKQYKSKKEFKDDLDLIWSNCYTYNATEVRMHHTSGQRARERIGLQNHPLRLCASRLQVKAERLLKNITDRKERVDPPIPSDLSMRRTPHKVNGVNGHARTPSQPSVHRPPTTHYQRYTPTITPAPTTPRRDLPFSESLAIMRTPEGMASFRELDQALDSVLSSSEDSHSVALLQDRLREYAGITDPKLDTDTQDTSTPVDGETGDKRKM